MNKEKIFFAVTLTVLIAALAFSFSDSSNNTGNEDGLAQPPATFVVNETFSGGCYQSFRAIVDAHTEMLAAGLESYNEITYDTPLVEKANETVETVNALCPEQKNEVFAAGFTEAYSEALARWDRSRLLAPFVPLQVMCTRFANENFVFTEQTTEFCEFAKEENVWFFQQMGLFVFESPEQSGLSAEKLPQ